MYIDIDLNCCRYCVSVQSDLQAGAEHQYKVYTDTDKLSTQIIGHDWLFS